MNYCTEEQQNWITLEYLAVSAIQVDCLKVINLQLEQGRQCLWDILKHKRYTSFMTLMITKSLSAGMCSSGSPYFLSELQDRRKHHALFLFREPIYGEIDSTYTETPNAETLIAQDLTHIDGTHATPPSPILDTNDSTTASHEPYNATLDTGDQANQLQSDENLPAKSSDQSALF